ncbi:MAG: hypothetical protein JJE04_21385 [Acidobacteriia bacterium]|nr:hypothetical protein [Terriglobia bacterium]
MKHRRFLLLAVVGVLAVGVGLASHSWGGYHWARTANPFTLKLGDNVTTAWELYLATTSSDWSQSIVLDTTVVAGSTTPKPCRATSGRVEICNSKYGGTGWLGVAQIWITGGVHIAQGIVKVNDTYFNTPTYNKPEWRNLVMCQEVGHTFGLDHQDENFSNDPLGTCMDYSNIPGPNQHPNNHDYYMLESIYAHLDAFTTLSASTPMPPAMNMDLDGPGQWGKLVKSSRGGKHEVYEQDFGGGHKVVTFVTWVPGEERGRGQ